MRTAVIVGLLAAVNAATAAPITIAREGELFYVVERVSVRYGTITAPRVATWRKSVGTLRCDAVTFAPDPAPGRVKYCQVSSKNPRPGVAKLSWVASPSPGVAEYRVYMTNTPGQYAAMGWAAGLQVTFGVAGLALGQTVYFSVKALDAGGVSSGFSNEASKTLVAP